MRALAAGGRVEAMAVLMIRSDHLCRCCDLATIGEICDKIYEDELIRLYPTLQEKICGGRFWEEQFIGTIAGLGPSYWIVFSMRDLILSGGANKWLCPSYGYEMTYISLPG